MSALVRLRAHWNSTVEVRDLADTVGPVAERNCIGAIPPGGEQREANEQSVTMPRYTEVRELDSVGGVGEPSSEMAKPEQNRAASVEGVDASGRAPQMVGDGMVGSAGDVNQGTTVGGGNRAGRGQSVRSSEEAGNDRGAKGRRNVVIAAGLDPTQKGRRSAARLCASVRRRVAWGQTVGGQWAAWEQVSGAERFARLVRRFRTPCDESLSQPIETTNWKAGCGRPACPVWVGGGGVIPTSYPHPEALTSLGITSSGA